LVTLVLCDEKKTSLHLQGWENVEIAHLDGVKCRIEAPVSNTPGRFCVVFEDGERCVQRPDRLFFDGISIEKLFNDSGIIIGDADKWESVVMTSEYWPDV
jgi:hypothetical protein